MIEHSPTFQSTVIGLAHELARVAAARVDHGPDQRIEWSDEALLLLELSRDDAPATWAAFIDRLTTEADRAAANMALAAARDHAHSVGCAMVVQASDGKRMRLSLLLKDAADGTAVVMQDTNYMHERESELLRAGESRDRLHQLGRWSLLGEMASGLAHEINQPLAAISAFAQAGERMLQLTPPKVERAGTLFGEIAGQALRAGDVVQRMRSLIKRQASSPARLESTTVLADFKGLAEALARTHQVQLEIIQPSEAASVLVDPAHIQQVLMSLLRNALDAMRDMPAAERRVRIEAQRTGDHVEFAITDSGPGIPPEVARELFRPFFTTKPEGTGLGLSVCRSIIAEHGGTLQFVNANPGARFSIRLPVSPSK